MFKLYWIECLNSEVIESANVFTVIEANTILWLESLGLE